MVQNMTDLMNGEEVIISIDPIGTYLKEISG
jgi:hypothetical protein